MEWRTRPKFSKRKNRGVTVLSIKGDLIRDMPRNWKSEVRTKLGKCENSERLVVDIQDVTQLGSWGENRIRSLARTIGSRGGSIGLVIDANRRSMYTGLKVQLGVVEPPVSFDVETKSAVKKVRDS